MAQDYIIKIEGSWPSGETEYVIGTDNPERLPAVSASDNGDVLTVVEGKWQDAAPSAGGLPAVTSDDNGDVLTVINGAWGKVGGYSVTESTETVIAGQTVTTVDDSGWIWAEISVAFSGISVGDVVDVTFNNANYTATVFDWDGNKALGELDGEGNPSFDNYPFFIDEMDGGAELVTETVETVTISATKTGKTATVSDDFAVAVSSVGGGGLLTKTPTTAIVSETLSVAVETHDGNYIISSTPVITVSAKWLNVAHNANIVATIDQHTYTFPAAPVVMTTSSSQLRNGTRSNENENLSVSLWVAMEDDIPTGKLMIAFLGWNDTIPDTGTVTISVPSFDLVGASDELVTALTLLGVYS